MESDEVWISTDEIAERLKVPKKTLASRAAAERGPRFARMGRYRRYRLSDHQHYEAIAKSRIDDLEAETRTRLSVADRVLRSINCPGRHHGQPADDCEYARPSLAA